MKGVKQQVIRMIDALPEEVTVDDIMAELYFRLQAETINKKDGLDWGLMTDIDTVYNTILFEMINTSLHFK